MEFPGIRKEAISKLDLQTQQAIRDHIKDLEALVDKKQDLIRSQDPNSKLLDFKGFDEVDDYEEQAKGEIKQLLGQLETQTDKLVSSINEEIRLVKEIRSLSAKADEDDTSNELMENIKAEIKDDLVIHSLLTDQQHALQSIHKITSDISHHAKPKLGEYVGEFDIIRSLLKNIIDGELPLLDLIYNLANVPGWVPISSKSSS